MSQNLSKSFNKLKMNYVVLQTKPSQNFQDNLEYLESLVKQCPTKSFILAPELALNGYAYNRLDEAHKISQKAIQRFLELSHTYTIALTLTIKENNNYYNTFHVFHQGQIIHTQSKIQLFVLNDERKNFKPGNPSHMKLFEIEGKKIGVLICFELRFIEYWQKLRGADIILIPSMWGIKRKEHFETLSHALAIANQCFVIASDSSDESCAKGSGIITPFGIVHRDDNKEIISQKIDFEEINSMRKYMNVGI